MSSTDVMRRLGRDMNVGRQSGLFSTLALAIVFICLFVTLWFSQIVDRGLRAMMSNYRTSIYLKSAPDAGQKERLIERLRKLQGVRDVRFVSAEQAKREILPNFGAQALQNIDSDAFP